MRLLTLCLLVLAATTPVWTQQTAAPTRPHAPTPLHSISGTVTDQTGRPLTGVVVELRSPGADARMASTDAAGRYAFESGPSGAAQVSFELANFARVRRAVVLPADEGIVVDVTLHLMFSADVAVTGKRTFTKLADAVDPARDLIGIAQSASQGAITGRQLDTRPMMRTGEVLETVPGVVISQHSGEGKANQYYLRGFNLDHGTDFSTTVAGMPVNLPTHAHGHGYSDLNFLVPELVSGVQFSKGPYFADQGDFTTAGSANINYVNALDRPIVRLGGGGQGFGRVLAAASPRVGRGRLLGALELQHNDGPWERPDDFEKVNGVVRYSEGDGVNGFSITAMGYRGTWNSTDQVPARAVGSGAIGRFGDIDPSDGGESSRYSAVLEWQRTRGTAATRVSAYGIAYGLDLFSNFTYFLDDPVNGDQFQQVDRRVVSGARVSHRRITSWADRSMQNTVGVQLRHDDISRVGLYRTVNRRRLGTVREDAVLQTSVGAFAQNETEWTPWLRTLAGVRVDGYRFGVDASEPANAGLEYAARVSPKAGVVVGPWAGTELYGNVGRGFHSNDARGATIAVDPVTGDPVSRVTPLVPATGAEVGLRTVRLRGLQSTVSLWTLALESELVFVGDAGTTVAGRASRRAGIEWANYYTPVRWLIVDGDVSVSRGRFTGAGPDGDRIPGAVETVVSAGVTVDSLRRMSGSLRWRYFGPRPLVEDNSVRSGATSLVNLEAGYRLSRTVRLALDVFNVTNARHSDIDYFYTSRLRGEPPGGVDDVHFHATLPRTARLNLVVGF